MRATTRLPSTAPGEASVAPTLTPSIVQKPQAGGFAVFGFGDGSPLGHDVSNVNRPPSRKVVALGRFEPR